LAIVFLPSCLSVGLSVCLSLSLLPFYVLTAESFLSSLFPLRFELRLFLLCNLCGTYRVLKRHDNIRHTKHCFADMKKWILSVDLFTNLRICQPINQFTDGINYRQITFDWMSAILKRYVFIGESLLRLIRNYAEKSLRYEIFFSNPDEFPVCKHCLPVARIPTLSFLSQQLFIVFHWSISMFIMFHGLSFLPYVNETSFFSSHRLFCLSIFPAILSSFTLVVAYSRDDRVTVWIVKMWYFFSKSYILLGSYIIMSLKYSSRPIVHRSNILLYDVLRRYLFNRGK